VYDVLDGLVEKGLVVEIASRPKKYRASKPTEVFQKLLKEKHLEIAGWETEAMEIGRALELEGGQSSLSSDEKVLKVKSRTDFYKILAQEMDSANKTIIGLSRLDAHHHLLHDALKRATERNVTVRLVGEHPPSFKESMAIHGKKVQLRDANHGMHAYVMDGKKVVMLLSDLKQEKPDYHFAIWPENQPLAQTLQQTFDMNWVE
jgi:sugar-specific transcriptional regulator TrmB